MRERERLRDGDGYGGWDDLNGLDEIFPVIFQWIETCLHNQQHFSEFVNQ